MAKINTNEIFERFKNIWGDRYDYSRVSYTRCDKKVEIGCKEHGFFMQQPNYHWNGQQGCRKCFHKERGSTQLNLDNVFERFKNKHGNIYDYSKVVYTTYNNPVEIICKKHGSFFQPPYMHWDGMICAGCKSEKISDKIFSDFKKFHKDKYDYSLVEFTRTDDDIIIICREHGEFRQLIANHRKGTGCPRCSKTRAEIFINEKHNKIFLENNRKIFGFEVDLLSPKFKFGIEYNGLLWHSFGKSFPNNMEEINIFKHFKKTLALNNNGYKLFNIESIEYSKKPEIVNSIISINIGNFNKIFARKCEVKKIQNIEVIRTFLEDNHLYYNPSEGIDFGYGLYHNNILVSVMSFRKFHTNSLILNYFTSLSNFRILGGISKMFKLFLKDYNFESLFTIAKKNYPISNAYNILGFEEKLYCFPVRKFIDKNSKKFLSIANENIEELLNQGSRIYYDCGEMIYEYNH